MKICYSHNLIHLFLNVLFELHRLNQVLIYLKIVLLIQDLSILGIIYHLIRRDSPNNSLMGQFNILIQLILYQLQYLLLAIILLNRQLKFFENLLFNLGLFFLQLLQIVAILFIHPCILTIFKDSFVFCSQVS